MTDTRLYKRMDALEKRQKDLERKTEKELANLRQKLEKVQPKKSPAKKPAKKE